MRQINIKLVDKNRFRDGNLIKVNKEITLIKKLHQMKNLYSHYSSENSTNLETLFFRLKTDDLNFLIKEYFI